MADVARRLTVHGRVQGVFFRVSTQRRARGAGVRGWVANRPDGAVEAWLEGPPDAVDAIEAWVRTGGPPAAEVTEVEVEPVDPAGLDGFVVRR
ncbi:acylphosphatase [Egicoccus halophilus]|uniref:Acylphosphatase n=1 Tax=Egicoccus halophilus TaxID=1670830 RepID=A0A8J3AAN6_9ACTN|nr:acylphosphatase [Egicoccus halophilus]GGI09299.1 acylphosphatase [Egicoccus halophilus]